MGWLQRLMYIALKRFTLQVKFAGLWRTVFVYRSADYLNTMRYYYPLPFVRYSIGRYDRKQNW